MASIRTWRFIEFRTKLLAQAWQPFHRNSSGRILHIVLYVCVCARFHLVDILVSRLFSALMRLNALPKSLAFLNRIIISQVVLIVIDFPILYLCCFFIQNKLNCNHLRKISIFFNFLYFLNKLYFKLSFLRLTLCAISKNLIVDNLL